MAMVYFAALNRSKRPVCSVCIANYNGEKLLIDCLDSLLNQAAAFDIEVIVHDDASTDGSVDLIKSRYPGVELLISESNVGFCTANNRMARISRGKYLLLLNNDAALDPNAMATLLRTAESIDVPGILTLPQLDWETGRLVDRGCLLDPFLNPVPNLDSSRDEVAYVVGACLWLPKTLWDELGGFPEWMESIGEDLYLCGLARLRGYPVRALRESHYKHRQGASFGGNRAEGRLDSTVRRRSLSEKNKTRAMMVLVPSPLMWPLLALHMGALLTEGLAIALLLRRFELFRTIYAPALAIPFLEFGTLRSRRRSVQGSRTTSACWWFRTVAWQLRKIVMLAKHGVPLIR